MFLITCMHYTPHRGGIMDLYHDEGTQYKVSQQQKIAEVPRKAYCEQV